MKQKKKARSRVQVVEEGEPLESSVIWSWMRNYYAQGGMAVWSSGDVPFHITNTPLLAAEWAKSVLAFVRDFGRLGLLDPNEYIEVFELGPGTGRHAYFLLLELQKLKTLTEAVFGQKLKFRIHLAELGESGLKSLSEHPNLEEALDSGELMLHQFDIESDLRPSQFYPRKTELVLPSVNPVFVIGNYILDSLSHDVVRVNSGQLRRGLTKLSVKGLANGADPMTMPNLGEKIKLTFSYGDEPIQYDEPHWNDLVGLYRNLEEETFLPFPTSSLRLAQRARKWSKVATCFLVADKSFTELDQMAELEEPELVPHGGGFSFNANLHAFGALALKCGGQAHHTSTRDGTLELSHVVFPASDVDPDWSLAEARFRCVELESFNAIDRFRVKESVDDHLKNCSLRLCLDLIRLTGFDPETFYELSDNILKGLQEESEEMVEMEEELIDILPYCLDLIYPLPDEVDVAFEIGRVAYRLDLYELACHAFTLSLGLYGKDPRTHFNLGLTWYYRSRYKKASEEFGIALELDPDYDEAEVWNAKCLKRSG
jgi:tetratricopeptide (TPR) repeat protein